MRRALAYFLVSAALGGILSAAGRISWNRVQYIGGSPPIKADSYDWDTTITIQSNSGIVELAVAPSSMFGHPQTFRFKTSQITGVVYGPGAWQKAADVPGVQLPTKPHGLFGLMNRRYLMISKLYTFVAILYDGDDGKPAAILLACESGGKQDVRFSQAIAELNGKQPVYAK